jgi:hypothetical protein
MPSLMVRPDAALKLAVPLLEVVEAEAIPDLETEWELVGVPLMAVAELKAITERLELPEPD